MIGILVCGENHFIVSGPMEDQEAAPALTRHWHEDLQSARIDIRGHYLTFTYFLNLCGPTSAA